ncbi:L,D-transpeptidase family protein [Dichotomicrobium thermohalophilum]|uniref:Murein L,D-transpeptidase YafK n=1 Tax=Dichotomicrobium thermohalophilum TaxID=933063 RepID=A0A397Q2Z4_9HYPH|nr:murein L,D-transpeptidase family protein [Dichotomicrobium thermohalophilum]RIA55890.1 murein L,D-transpeptidase YafK [Dichotomicrobium thermohalophilum]
MAGTFSQRALTALVLLLAAVSLSGCLGEATAPHLKPIPAAAQARLAKMGMTADAPILVRIFKEEAELEIWKKKDDGRFHLFKTYPICFFSGKLGPKLKEGDKQAPEGFYTVSPGRMNPNSDFHLSFNLGYPNRFDAAHGRTGAHLMVHGDCSSAGCYAMTDALIEEIYAIAREAFEGGQRRFHVHAFPFRMTEENMARHQGNRWYGFWQMLKAGYDAFEQTRVQPSIAVCEKRYLVNAEFLGDVAKPDPKKECPPHRILDPETILARLAGEETEVAAQSRPTNKRQPQETTASISQTPRTAEPKSQRPVIAASVAAEEPAPAETQSADPAPRDTEETEPTGDAGPWVVPEGTPAGANGDRAPGSST